MKLAAALVDHISVQIVKGLIEEGLLEAPDPGPVSDAVAAAFTEVLLQERTASTTRCAKS